MIPIVGMLSSFGATVLIVYFVVRSRQRQAEVHAEVQSKLIERFGSAPEMISFLQSTAGREFVAGVQRPVINQTRERILGGFTRSIVLTALGLGFLFLTFREDDAFVIPGTIVLSLGLGYLVATLVSWRLSARLNAESQTGA
ncbi:MAG TPA: hypothetical protein VKB93_16910 [Thermoanaerobaculia bacterium]|nr:hypothetical protein [Thermoanaerobaculia bacterium]